MLQWNARFAVILATAAVFAAQNKHAKDDVARSRAEQFLAQLTTLEGALLPA